MRRRLAVGAVALLICAVGAPAPAATPPTVTVEVIGQGTVTGTGIDCGAGSLSCYSAYGSAASVTLTAAPASGWTFSGWQDACSGTSTCALSPGGNMPATAVFAISGVVQTSTLTVAPTNGGVANGSTNYGINCDPGATSPAPTACSLTVLAGSTLTMAETPDSGYLFQGWGGACSGTGPSCAVYLTASQSVSAGFVAAASTTLAVTVTGNGSVTGGGINCGSGATCSTSEPPNTSVTLSATPASGYALTGWSGGGCSGTQLTCTVQMSSSATLTAAFAQVVPLSVTVTGDGYVTGGGIGCDGTPLGQTCTANETPGTTVTLTATANSGETPFWSGCLSSAGNTCTITGIASATAVSVSFSGSSSGSVATNLLTVTVHGDGYVQAAAGSQSIYCTAAGGAGCTASVAAGTSITLSAVPASQSTTDFTSWGGACISFTSTTCTLTMTSAVSATATFVGGNTTYTLTVQAVGSGSISGAGIDCGDISTDCSSPQAAGAAVTLTATPDFGSAFSGWGGSCSGTNTTCTVSMTTSKTATATFSGGFGGALAGLTVSVTGAGKVTGEGIDCAGAAGKTKTCEGSYTSGKKVTLSAKPAAGDVFAAWSGACSGAKPTCALTVASTMLVGAKFIHVVLASTHSPTVVRTKAGYRVTLWFRAGERGAVAVVARRAGTVVVKHRVLIEPGGRHVLFTVATRGHYTVTLTLAKHTLRWRVTV